MSCGEPACPQCAVRTPVGLKCRACARPVERTTSATAHRRPFLLIGAGVVLAALTAVIAFTRPHSSRGPTVVAPRGSWSPIAAMPTSRGTATAVVLRSGQVLVAGGGVGAIPLAGAELFDPDSRQWRSTGSMVEARRGHRAVVLADGHVLVVGGIAQGRLLASAEIFDSAIGSWKPVAAMAIPRLGFSLSLMGDGRVLAAGGITSTAADGSADAIRPLSSAEIYDPAAARWMAAPSMEVGRFDHTATVLDDGRVLIAGGLGPGPSAGDATAALGSSELYDPASNTFQPSGDLGQGRANHAAVLLDDGTVLAAGGITGETPGMSVRSAERYDPRDGAWAATGSMTQARSGETLTRLRDGRVLVAAGDIVVGPSRHSLVSAELYDPQRGSWWSAGAMSCPRSQPAAVALADDALVLGGDAAFADRPAISQACVEQYRP
ncbi:MAG: hypothetical protein M3083_10855 [Actinomycetota bacterium]|nr:hypothetical protein [Actinomycetota bacterium]MDQ6944835.1 hypothetical protein [Actinomycetota bacterium]